MDYKNIIAAKRRQKLEDQVISALSDPSTTSVRVKSRYKEDIDDLESRFKHQYEIKREEFPTGYSATVIHQMKTPLEKKCEELQKKLGVEKVTPYDELIAIKRASSVSGGICGELCMPINRIARSYFDSHTVEELAAAIEGLYFA